MTQTGTQPVLRHYTVDDGLPSSEVYRVDQDANGYMWFATDNGVSKFNGYNFVNYTVNDGLTDNAIISFYNDYSGRRWCITLNSNLCYFEDGKIQTYTYNDTIRKYLEGATIISFATDSNDAIYCGSRYHGILRIDANGTATHFKDGYGEGRLILNIEGDLVYASLESASPYSHEMVVTIIEDTVSTFQLQKNTGKSGTMRGCSIGNGYAMSTGEQIYFLRNDGTQHSYSTSVVNFLKYDEGVLWVGSYKNGIQLMSVHDSSIFVFDHFLVNQSITDYKKDAAGGVWFSTISDGVFYTPNLNVRIHPLDNIVKDDEHISSIATDGQVVYLGMGNGQLVAMDDKYVATMLNPNPSPEVAVIFFDEYSRTIYADIEDFAANFEIIEQVNIGATKLSSIGITFNAICVSSDSSVWMGNHRGVFQYRNSELVFSSIETNPVTRIHALLEDHTGRLLIATAEGIFVLEDELFQPLVVNNETIDYRVDELCLYGRGTMLGTRSQGLLYWDAGGIQNLTTEDELPSNTITSLFNKNDTLWIGTDNGVCRLTSVDKHWQFVTINKSHGLLSNEINDLIIHNDRLWLATNKGLCSVETDAINKVQPLPKVYVTGLSINYRDTIPDSYVLPHSYNTFEFSFVGIHYSIAGEVTYRYRLVGLDTSWTYGMNTNAIFRSLVPGTYKFQVEAMNENGIWTNGGPEYELIILPPYWQTWWFRSGIFLLIVAFIALFFRIKVLTYNRDVVREILQSILIRLSRRTKFPEPFVIVKSVKDGSHTKIDLSTIKWIKSDGNYLNIICIDRKVVVRNLMKNMENELGSAPSIIRVHKSYIVNMDRTTSVSSREIKVGDIHIPVGRKYLGAIRAYKAHLNRNAIN